MPFPGAGHVIFPAPGNPQITINVEILVRSLLAPYDASMSERVSREKVAEALQQYRSGWVPSLRILSLLVRHVETIS